MFQGALCIITMISLSSCKKFVEILPPSNQVELNKIFLNDQAAISATLGLYIRMTNNNLIMMNGGVTLYTGLSSDEFYNVSPDTELDQFTNNALLADNGTGVYSNLWKASFQNIYHCNAVLQGLTNSAKISEVLKKQLRGEMLVGRALNYFYLVNLFGDVPLILTTEYEINSMMPRKPSEQIYERIIADLIEAESLLSISYPSLNRARPNKYTATALLARVYLYQKNWQLAAEKSSLIIQSGIYSLESIPSKVFLSGSNETIWQLKPTSTAINTAEGLEFNPYDTFTVPKYSLTNSLLNNFEMGDRRKQDWINSNSASGHPIYYPYKYKVGYSSITSEYYIIFRLAELYLIRAEANAHLNNISQSLSDINVIRNRSQLPNKTATNLSTLLTHVEKENRLEFFAEWGHRWFDLKRNNSIDNTMSLEKGNAWQITDALYPIPLSQIQLNPLLVQNPGY